MKRLDNKEDKFNTVFRVKAKIVRFVTNLSIFVIGLALRFVA
jgi:hypothetical protein